MSVEGVVLFRERATRELHMGIVKLPQGLSRMMRSREGDRCEGPESAENRRGGGGFDQSATREGHRFTSAGRIGLRGRFMSDAE
jgi:hypothetical protein